MEKSIGIIGTGSFLPERVIDNHYFEGIMDTSDEWIVKRTGIKERRIAEPDVCPSDLGTEAAKRALEAAGLTALELDLIIVATVTPDMMFPAVSCIIQDNIGATNAVAFDINAACSGFLYGLSLAESLIQSGKYKNAMVLGAETLSRITDYHSRKTGFLFGDGAGAAILTEVEAGYGLLSSELGSDGSGGVLLNQPAGGSRMPATAETVEQGLHYLHMDGNEVFKFAARKMAEASEIVLEKAGLTKADISYIIPHQANLRIIKNAAARLEVPMDKVFLNIHKYGNMSAASLATAFDEVTRSGVVKKGDIVLAVGFGAGLSWGANLIKWC